MAQPNVSETMLEPSDDKPKGGVFIEHR